MVITLNSSNPKSERYFWLNSDFNEGNIKHKKWRTDSCESILRFSDPILQKFELFDWNISCFRCLKTKSKT